MLLKIDKGSPEWHDLRRNKIGASMAPIVMGVGFKTPYRLWQEMLGFVEPEVNSAMKRGTLLEPEIRAQYIQMTGIPVEPAVAQHDECPWLIASADGWNEHMRHGAEFKTA